MSTIFITYLTGLLKYCAKPPKRAIARAKTYIPASVPLLKLTGRSDFFRSVIERERVKKLAAV